MSQLVIKITKKGKCGKDKEPVLYFSTNNARFNASSRDYLQDPDYVNIKIGNDCIIMSPSFDKSDWKVSKTGGLRFICSSGIFRYIGNLPAKTKLFGIYENGKLIFQLPSD